MDFVADTPTSPYGLSLELLGINYGQPWTRARGLENAQIRTGMHTYTYVDPYGYNNSTWWDMPGDNRDYGEGY